MSRIGISVPNVFGSEGTGPVSVTQIDTNNTTIQGWVTDSSNGMGYWLQDTGSANNYIVTYPASILPSSLTTGFWLVMRAANTNTGACQITINGLAAQPITDVSGNPLTNASIVANNNYAMMYTGTAFFLMFPTATASLVGEVKMFASTAFPTNYLACNGSLVSQTTYSTLFSVIGTAFGSGSGTFGLPNYNGAFPTHGTPGSTGGSNATTLSIANLPAHNHPATSTDSGHVHTTGALASNQVGTGAGFVYTAGGSGGPQTTGTGSASITTNIGNTGSGASFNNVPAYQAIQFIIRAF